MTNPLTTPAHIGPTEDGSALRIGWEDGHESVYHPRDLRMEGMYPTAIEYVGRYALQFFWSDGHSTGFYPYDLLRSLCGCSTCLSQGEHE
jgi:DUF971 family protein